MLPASSSRSWSAKGAQLTSATLLALAVTVLSTQAEGQARLVPPIEGADVNTLGVERDGTRRIVAHGMRALAHPDGALSVGTELFPSSRGVQVLELPPRFGRGFLFWLSAAGRSSLWRATSFTSKLTPFALLDFEIARVLPGFDRIYAQARRTGDWVALDALTGAGLDRGSLPASPSYGAMAFVDEWFGAVELPVRGPAVSFDAGGTWHDLGRSLQILGEDRGQLLLATSEGRKRLGPDGAFRAAEAPVIAEEASPAASGAFAAQGRVPLAAALLRGFADSANTAVVAIGGALSRVRLGDGRVLDTRNRVLPAASECAALPLGKGFGFCCREAEDRTVLYALEPSLGLRKIQSFEGPRAILSSGNGGLVIRGGCQRQGPAVGAHCVRAPSGVSFEITAKRDPGSERVVALKDGRAAMLISPHSGEKGELLLLDANGKVSAFPLVFEARDPATRSLLGKGFWLDAMVETAEGSLSGWVVGSGVFAGVRLSLDGHVRAGPLRHGIESALLAGERALLIPSRGIAEQSVDGGASFSEVDLPGDLELDARKTSRTPALNEQGCSALGCVFAGWMRLGWDGSGGGRRLVTAENPKPTSFPAPGGGRWILRCSPNGDSSAPALISATSTGTPEGKAPWLALFEQPPPAHPRDAVLFDTGGDSELRAYAWAPRGGADFGKAGKVTVSVLDSFRTHSGVWTTTPVSSPWSDASQAAEVFGYEGSMPSVWHVTLDPSGRSGVLSVSARGSTELFALEENRALTGLANASGQGIGNVTSAVRLGATFYVAAQEESRSIRVFALESGEARLLGQYADLAQGRGSMPSLVRSTRGNMLGIWTRGAGWYVFPLDPRTGAVMSAFEISPATLGRVPRSCAPDEEGYLLEGAIGVEPYVDFVGGAEQVSAHAYEGRFVVNDRGICVSALAAQSDGAISRDLRARGANKIGSLSLTVRDQTEGGRRWGFYCSD